MSTKPNIALLIFDIIVLPIIIIRLILIYFFGSKYNIHGMEFLDVMFHASQPYFNQEVGATIDVLHEDVRATVKRETKLFEDPFINEIKEQQIKEQPKIEKIEQAKIEQIKEQPKIEQVENVTKQKKINIAKKLEPDEISVESGESESTEEQEETETEIETETNQNTENDYDSGSETESEQILDTYTEESHATTEAETVLRNIMNKKTEFDLDVHIDQLFDDLENSVTTMTQSQAN